MKQAREKNILVFEPHASGHHGPYLHWMTAGLAERGFHVTVVTLPESMDHPSMQAIEAASQLQSGLELHLVEGRSYDLSLNARGGTAGLAAREFAYWRLFKKWYRVNVDKARPDVVFLPYLDYCLHAIGLLGSPFGSCPWAGLAMRPSFHYRQMGVIAPRPTFAWAKEALLIRVLANRHLRRFLTIDEPLFEYLSTHPERAAKIAFLAEPTDLANLPTMSEARQRMGLPKDRWLILVYGSITARKGVHGLLKALADPAFPSSVDVLLAGKIDQEIHHLLTTPAMAGLTAQGRVRLLDRYIQPEEEPLIFAAANIIWLGYRGHYSASGVLVQAMRAGRPVLACREGILGWQVRRHHVGEIVDPENIHSVVQGVKFLLGLPDVEVAFCPGKSAPIVSSIALAVDRLSLALTT